MKRLAALAAGIALCALSPAAHATLALVVTDNGTPVSGTTIVGPGTISFTSLIDPDFASITVSGSGFPSEPNPDLSMVTLAAKTSAIGAGHVLGVELTQTEPAAFAGGNTATTYTYNGLVGSPGPVTGELFYNGTLLNSHTFQPSATPLTFVATDVVPAADAGFTDRMIMDATFGAGNQSLGYTQQFKGVAVDEPGALGLLSVGVLGLGLALRKRRRII